MAVTLVIKTPSLKLSDLTYSCDASTSVFQLKTYLENQYPSKPKPEEQRLIYQGRLVRDNEILCDFLRDLDSEERHTLHLVYTLKRSLSAENREITGMHDVAAPANQTDDGLRLRHNVAQQSTSAVPIVQSTGAAPIVQPTEWVTNGQIPAMWANQAAGMDPVTQQMLWWQQTYAQQYWAQYMRQISSHQYPAANLNTQQVPAATTVQPPPQVVAPADPDRPQQPEDQELQQQQQQRRPPMAAVGGVAQDDDDEGGIRAARDWLDWIYVGSRLAILLGVMYYYSSLPRFMLVTLIVAGIYLYQKAIHQRRHIVPPVPQRQGEVNNNVGQAAEQAPQQPAQPVAEVPAPAAQAPADEADPVAANPERAPGVQAAGGGEAPAQAITPTAFNVALNLLIGFFSSLIPEVPAPEALN